MLSTLYTYLTNFSIKNRSEEVKIHKKLSLFLSIFLKNTRDHHHVGNIHFFVVSIASGDGIFLGGEVIEVMIGDQAGMSPSLRILRDPGKRKALVTAPDVFFHIRLKFFVGHRAVSHTVMERAPPKVFRLS